MNRPGAGEPGAGEPGDPVPPDPAPASPDPAPPVVTPTEPGEPPPSVRAAAEALFGDQLPLAVRYATMLATDGVVRGLIGPREASRIWQRHLLNSAAVVELVPTGASMIDVGSGAGLPGVALALARADLNVVLLEPMARRTAFLDEVVRALSLAPRVRVWRARAEESPGRLPPAGVVVARALAPLDRLARWCLPLTEVGGRVLAVKGEAAGDEVATHRRTIHRLGGGSPALRRCGVGTVDPPVTVVEILRVR